MHGNALASLLVLCHLLPVCVERRLEAGGDCIREAESIGMAMDKDKQIILVAFMQSSQKHRFLIDSASISR